MRTRPTPPSRPAIPVRGRGSQPTAGDRPEAAPPVPAASEDDRGTALEEAWATITCDARLTVEVEEGALPLTDPRVLAATVAVLHAAAARAEHELVVEIRADRTVRVHDDGGPPERLLGVLATTARDALRELGADLAVGTSDRLGGTMATIRRPDSTNGGG